MSTRAYRKACQCGRHSLLFHPPVSPSTEGERNSLHVQTNVARRPPRRLCWQNLMETRLATVEREVPGAAWNPARHFLQILMGDDGLAEGVRAGGACTDAFRCGRNGNKITSTVRCRVVSAIEGTRDIRRYILSTHRRRQCGSGTRVRVRWRVGT